MREKQIFFYCNEKNRALFDKLSELTKPLAMSKSWLFRMMVKFCLFQLRRFSAYVQSHIEDESEDEE